MREPKISIILPSRGLIFAEVENAIEKERIWHDITVFRSWDKVIPDSFNELTEKALRFNPDYIWFIEEDTVPPHGALELLLQANADIACIDYGVNTWSCTARNTETDEILWCGLGCTLVKKQVFDALKTPYFRTDKMLRINDWEWIDNTSKSAYGGHDIWFFCQAREARFCIKQVNREAKHLKLDSLGVPEVNLGLHQIGRKPSIQKQQMIMVPKVTKKVIISGHTLEGGYANV